jgi:hypothetical protein
MNRLNLHGTRHADVERSVIRFVEGNWGKNKPVVIITGNSPQMKELVTNILDEYKLSYSMGDALGMNKGTLHVEPF